MRQRGLRWQHMRGINSCNTQSCASEKECAGGDANERSDWQNRLLLHADGDEFTLKIQAMHKGGSRRLNLSIQVLTLVYKICIKAALNEKDLNNMVVSPGRQTQEARWWMRARFLQRRAVSTSAARWSSCFYLSRSDNAGTGRCSGLTDAGSPVRGALAGPLAFRDISPSVKKTEVAL